MRSPNPTQVDRGTIQQWNVAYEYRLPGDIAAEIAYVGTRTDGGYADLNINYGEPGGGNASRQYFDIAGTTAINDWAARTKSRYHGLQIAVNRPLRDNLLLKGAYTYSRSKNMADEDKKHAFMSIQLKWPRGSDYDLDEIGFEYRVVGGDAPAGMLPEAVVVAPVSGRRVEHQFTWQDVPAGEQKPLYLQLEVRAVTRDRQRGAPARVTYGTVR